MGWNSGNLRWRLTLWYETVFALLLLFFISVASVIHYYQLKAQVFHGEIQDLEAVEGLLYEAPNGSIQLNERYFNRPEMPMRLDHMLEVLDSHGTILLRNARLSNNTIDGALEKNEGNGSYNERVGRLSDGRQIFLISHAHRIGPSVFIIRLAYESAPIYASQLRFGLSLLLLAPFTILIGGYFVYRMTASALSPLSDMVKRAERITVERLSERLPALDTRDELGATARAFNDLLQRIEESFSQLKRFTSDASHELRTPLSSLRSMGEVSLQRERSADEYREVIASMLEEVGRLTHLVEYLLTISRADSGQIVLDRRPFSLRDLLEESVSLVEILAEEKQQRILLDCPEDFPLLADRAILRQAFLNILGNAIKYSPSSSSIAVQAQKDLSLSVTVRISDQGPGIPTAEQQKIFDRFYRTDEGRSTGNGGYGLGLSITKWAVDVHHGRISIDPSYAGGACFCVQLPLRRATPQASL